MYDRLIINYALLSVNYDYNRDHLDNLAPFVAECVRHLSVSKAPVKRSMVKKNLDQQFGQDLPGSVIRELVDRLLKDGRLMAVGSGLGPGGTEEEQSRFSGRREQCRQDYESIVGDLVVFCEKSGIQWQKPEAGKALDDYFAGNAVALADELAGRSGSPLAVPRESTLPGAHEVVSAFIASLDRGNVNRFSILRRVFRGCILAAAIHLPSDDQNPDLKGPARVYLDTPFLTAVLGYEDEEAEESCRELLDFLQAAGASLRCFRHTFEELRGVLSWCREVLRDRRSVPSPRRVLRHFQSTGATAIDVNDLIIHLMEAVNGLGVVSEDAPSENHADEGRLMEHLKAAQELRYGSDAARENDVRSVGAIMTLRAGKLAYELAECTHLLVTTNETLVRAVNRFYASRSRKDLPLSPLMTDFVLSNALWLGRNFPSPRVLRSEYVADAYAALGADSETFDKIIETIRRKQESADVPETLFEHLRELRAHQYEERSQVDSETWEVRQETPAQAASATAARAQAEVEREIAVEVEEFEAQEQTLKRAMAGQRRKLTRAADKVALALAVTLGGLSGLVFLLPAFANWGTLATRVGLGVAGLGILLVTLLAFEGRGPLGHMRRQLAARLETYLGSRARPEAGPGAGAVDWDPEQASGGRYVAGEGGEDGSVQDPR